MINYNELFEKSKELANKSGLTQLELYQRFMFERILERISVSKYNSNFILKGGLLLSAMLGIESRSTRDMDISIKGIDVSKDPRRTELLRAKMKTQADIAESQKAVDRLEELVKRGENAKISVVRKVYSGCVVTIDQQTLTVKELQESVCFQKKKEGVVMISLK